MRGKRGQAAMEFLMTYGWAILAAVIVIAVLASFGVFSPSKYIPTSCTVSAPWGCDKNQVKANGGVPGSIDIQLLNGGGQTYDSVQLSLSGDCTGNMLGGAVDDWTDGNSTTVTVNCTAGEDFTAGQKVKAD